MTVEILYPSVATLFGESFDIKYLEKCLPGARFVKTHLNDVPAFVNEDVDMIFMGATTEKLQKVIVEKLTPYKSRLEEMIENNTLFLLTGNAFEIFGRYIEDKESGKTDCLGIFETYAKRDMFNRHNSLFLGEFKNMKIVGFRSQFSHSYPTTNTEGLFKKIKGFGINPDSDYEGIRKNNFFATYLLGPILILNPDFTKYILSLVKPDIGNIPLESDLREAYEKRLKEFEDPNTVFSG